MRFRDVPVKNFSGTERQTLIISQMDKRNDKGVAPSYALLFLEVDLCTR